MLPVEHHLHAVRPPTQVAIPKMAEVFPDPLRWNHAFLRRAQTPAALAKAAAPSKPFMESRRVILFIFAPTTSLHACSM